VNEDAPCPHGHFLGKKQEKANEHRCENLGIRS